MADALTDIRDELSELAARVAELEASPPPAPAGPPRGGELDEETFWALTGLKDRLAHHPSTRSGAVMLVGSLGLPGRGPVEWQQAVGTEGLLESDWSERASVFAALGHPVRLELLRLVLGGTASTADLARTEGLGTTGQLHHHLRQLVSAGWVRQAGRGHYEVPPARVVALLALVAGAER